MSNNELVEKIVSEVVSKITAGEGCGPASGAPAISIPISVSNRHIHLCQEDMDVLFGPNYAFKVIKNLSQPGQFAYDECVMVVGPKGAIPRVRILGPARKRTQVEILPSDQFAIGLTAPVRDSGDLENTPPVTLVGPKGTVVTKGGLIVADRHIHLSNAEGARFGLRNGDRVAVHAKGLRTVTFHDVLCRVGDQYAMDMHIDMDEANAAMIKTGDPGLVKKQNS